VTLVGRADAPALGGWVAARVCVAGALALSRFLVNELGAADPTGRPPSGLLGWDADWYVRIVRAGYEHLPWESTRFFPLLPVLADVLRPLFGPRAAVLLVVNAAALVAGVLLVRLARLETGDDALAGRAGWLLALLPPAFVLAMGYAEALFVCFAIATFLALRRRRFGWAAAMGALAGLSRPLGVLLVLPALIEAWRAPRGRDTSIVARLAASVAPAAGMGGYFAWSWVAFGDAFRSVTVQQAFDRRGGFENPIGRLVEAARQLAGGADLGSGLHFPWAVGFLVLLAVLFRRWPASYGAFAAAIVFVALSAHNLDSLERYGLSAFPLVLALADVLRPRWAETAAIALCGAGLVAYATLAFAGAYVP
jgi:hypothetical protein